MTEFAINVRDLTKKFNEQVAVDHISMQVKTGSIFGFLGSNGSGKTTTIRMICGLLNPSEGQGTCLGYDIRSQRDDIKRNIGYMPQKFSFYKGLTVQQNLRFLTDIYQIEDAPAAIETIIEDLDLSRYRNHRAEALSGGWQQRLALACCLVHRPRLLFLDEPTAGVDPKARKEFWDYLHLISREHKTTILVTTHYMDEVEKCSDIAYINRGKLLYTGKTKDLILHSDIITYVFDGSAFDQEKLITAVNKKYPKLLTSTINNVLRISSQDEKMLDAMRHDHPDCAFKKAPPSFEEIFIGLIA